MIESVEFFPFGEDVIYARDEEGENEYFRILAAFEYDEKSYIIYQFTTSPECCHIGEAFSLSTEDDETFFRFMSLPVSEEGLDTLMAAWNRYLEDNDIAFTYEEEDNTSAE